MCEQVRWVGWGDAHLKQAEVMHKDDSDHDRVAWCYNIRVQFLDVFSSPVRLHHVHPSVQ